MVLNINQRGFMFLQLMINKVICIWVDYIIWATKIQHQAITNPKSKTQGKYLLLKIQLMIECLLGSIVKQIPC